MAPGSSEDVTVHYRRGAECLTKGDAAGAVAHLRRATELTPSYAWAHQNLAQAYRALGQMDAAERAYRRALALDPDYVAALVNLGSLLGEAGRYAEAVDVLKRALARAPNEPVVRDACATALRVRAQELFDRAAYADAARHAAQAMDIVPDDVDGLVLLGDSLQRSFAFEQAIAIFDRARKLEPSSARVLTGLGTAFYGANRLAKAADVLEQAAAADRGYAPAYSALGVVYQEQGRLDDAVTSFRRALALDPTLHRAHSNLLFTLCFKADADPAEVFAEHRRFDERFAAPLRDPTPHANSRDPERRLRIGYVSPYFNRTAGGLPLLAPVECHDRNGFELYCYSTNLFDDDFTERFRAAAEHWVDVRGLPDEAVAFRIRNDRIDILVDVAGHMAGSRLLVFARKPAPVQVSYPTYPNTTGLSAIDYRITDRYFGPPSADAFHTERLVRLPEIYVSFEPLDRTVAPEPAPPVLRNGYVTFGCFNNLAKINTATLNVWARLLGRVPSARLMVKWKGLDDADPNWLVRRLSAAGIDQQKIILAGWAPSPYESYKQIDICLDPLHVNGGTTTFDSLWMGVPVITQCGETPFSRVGLCLLTNVGLPELVAASDDEYLRIATDIARDLDRLTELRRGLRERLVASPIMDGPRYTRRLESAYREMWRHWCATS